MNIAHYASGPTRAKERRTEVRGGGGSIKAINKDKCRSRSEIHFRNEKRQQKRRNKLFIATTATAVVAAAVAATTSTALLLLLPLNLN